VFDKKTVPIKSEGDGLVIVFPLGCVKLILEFVMGYPGAGGGLGLILESFIDGLVVITIRAHD